MASEDILKDILLEVHRIECGVTDDLPDFKPSLRHRTAMKRIFARFERNTLKLRNKETAPAPPMPEHRTRIHSIKRRVLIAMLVIILAALLAGCVSTITKFVSECFNGTVYEDNTQLFAVDSENCPQTIEQQYALTYIPENFELIETIPSQANVYTLYSNELTGKIITLNQWVKSIFATHYNTENHEFEEIGINGTTVLYIDLSTNVKTRSVLIWDNGDYIIEILADLDKNSTLDLLNINKL